MSAAYRHCVNGLLTSIVWTLTGRLYDVYITDSVFIRCVGGYSLYVILQLLGGLGGGVQVGGGEVNFVFQKCSWGSETHANENLFFGGGRILGCLGRPTPPPGGRAGSENNTLLPVTMTCDRLKFWSGPAWRSKVIIRKPWRRKKKKKKKKKKKNSDKTIRHSRREAGNA